jgi:putative transposase
MRRERKNIRLGNFDYRSECSHFLTICTGNREHFFGKIRDKKMELSPIGEIAHFFWTDIPKHFPHVILDEFIIMPNHMHGIIKLDYSIIRTCHYETSPRNNNKTPIGPCHGMALLSNPERSPNSRQIQFNKFGYPVSGSVSVIINHFKSAVKRWCNTNGYDYFFWQPRFYDHIIKNQKDLMRIRKYIKLNPAEWDHDQRLTK